MTETDLKNRVANLDWYHTMDLPGGVVTPGMFDHRPVLDRYDLPADLSGKRVLDVGTFDGFFAFELERRGAAEVIAIDLAEKDALDWPAPMWKSTAAQRYQPRRVNFDLAKEALGSEVQHVFCSAYDTTPEKLGMFDFVFIGSLLIHLRDPVGALMSVLEVCRGEIQLGEHTEDRRPRALFGRSPCASFKALDEYLTWWVPNRACLDHWLLTAGFVDVRRGQTFTVPFRGRRGGIRHSVACARKP